MNPFTRFESLSRVLDWLDGQNGPCVSETVSLAEARGRVLAGELAAPLDFPPFDHAALDGYAVRGLETLGAGSYGALALLLQGDVAAGDEQPGTLAPGTAMRLAAGAPLPAGADAVVPPVFAEESAGRVEITAAVAPGENVVRRGTDVRAGSRLLPAGRRIRARDMAVLAACGIARVEVIGRPRVRVLIAGQGLAAAGAARGAHEVFEADALMLAALVERDGGDPAECRRISTDRAALAEALREPGADLILIAGGSGEGGRDFAAAALKEVGELAFHGIALEPGRSAGVGRVGNALVFLLPGAPVACLCAYDCLAAPTLRCWSGLGASRPYPERRTVLLRKIASTLGSVDYRRVRLTSEGAEPVASGGHSGLATLAAADGFILVPEDSEGFPGSAEVAVLLYDAIN
jgi:molybdopterin molybdotransferase